MYFDFSFEEFNQYAVVFFNIDRFGPLVVGAAVISAVCISI